VAYLLEYRMQPGEILQYQMAGYSTQDIIENEVPVNKKTIQIEQTYKIHVLGVEEGILMVKMETVEEDKEKDPKEKKEEEKEGEKEEEKGPEESKEPEKQKEQEEKKEPGEKEEEIDDSEGIIVFDRRGAYEVDMESKMEKYNDLDVFYGSFLLSGLILPKEPVDVGDSWEFYDSQGNRNFLYFEAIQEYRQRKCFKIIIHTFTEEGIEFPVEGLGEITTDATSMVLFDLEGGIPLHIQGENISYINHLSGEREVLKTVYQMDIQ